MAQLDKKSLERIRRSVQWTEAQSTHLAGQPNTPRERARGFWAELTDEPSKGVYSWTRKQSDGAGGLDDDVSGATGMGSAYETNGKSGIARGERARLYFAGFSDSHEPIYLFSFGGVTGFWVEIRDHKRLGPNRWRYAGVEMEEADDGELVVKEGGRVFGLADGANLLLNKIEDNNSASGVQGNSVDLADLPSGVTEISPVRGKPRVWVHTCTTLEDGSLSAKFTYENHAPSVSPPTYTAVLCTDPTETITVTAKTTGGAVAIGSVHLIDGECWRIVSTSSDPADYEISGLDPRESCEACADDPDPDNEPDDDGSDPPCAYDASPPTNMAAAYRIAGYHDGDIIPPDPCYVSSPQTAYLDTGVWRGDFGNFGPGTSGYGWYIDGTVYPLVSPGTGEGPSINGKLFAFHSNIRLKQSEPCYWIMAVHVFNSFGTALTVWEGEKHTGSTPAGVYTRSDGCASGPGALRVVAGVA